MRSTHEVETGDTGTEGRRWTAERLARNYIESLCLEVAVHVAFDAKTLVEKAGDGSVKTKSSGPVPICREACAGQAGVNAVNRESSETLEFRICRRRDLSKANRCRAHKKNCQDNSSPHGRLILLGLVRLRPIERLDRRYACSLKGCTK